jgi:hypothetical protein
MLRISLFGPPNRRIQPERYVQYALIFWKIIEKLLTKEETKYIIISNYRRINTMKYIRDNIIKYIMDRFIENRLKFKYILSVMIVALIFILVIFVISDKNSLWRYFDIPSLLCVGVLPFFIMCVLFGFSNTKRIFTISFIKLKLRIVDIKAGDDTIRV